MIKLNQKKRVMKICMWVGRGVFIFLAGAVGLLLGGPFVGAFGILIGIFCSKLLLDKFSAAQDEVEL